MSSNIERLVENGETLKEVKHLYARSWADISSKLPEDFSPHYENFARSYFRAQLRIAKGQKRRASEILRGLDKKAGYLEFEQSNLPLLTAIDLAVRGTTNWSDNLGKPVVPLFRFNSN
ncbi:MAG: hypothetical protein AAB875_05790 [Patescibacteria group bacterium]